MGLLVRLFVLGFLVAAATMAAGEDCARLEKAVEDALKGAAAASVETIGDNSAHRANLAELKTGNFLLLAGLNLDLMRDHGCAMPAEPVYAGRYMLPALECSTDVLQTRGSGKNPESCDRDKWKPHYPERKASDAGSG